MMLVVALQNLLTTVILALHQDKLALLVEMVLFVAQVSYPLTPTLFVGTEYLQIANIPLHFLVEHQCPYLLSAYRALFNPERDWLDARLAEVGPTALCEVKVSQQQQTHWTLVILWELFNEVLLIATNNLHVLNGKYLRWLRLARSYILARHASFMASIEVGVARPMEYNLGKTQGETT